MNRRFSISLTHLMLSAVLFRLVCWSADTPPKLRLAEVQQARPSSYAVELTLDPDKEDFSGLVKIRVDVADGTPILWLNATNITVQEASVAYGGEKHNGTVIQGGSDFLGLKFEKPIAAGTAEAEIKYTGKFMLTTQSGVFRTQDGGDYYLLTQFEQTDARRAFPCFDEPLYKVPWQVTLHVPQKDSAVSNTPLYRRRRKAQPKPMFLSKQSLCPVTWSRLA